jgi:hypothetical protein
MFVLFLNELIDILKSRNLKGVFLQEDADNFRSLSYTDDITGMADTVLSLQQQIDCVYDVCDQCGMMITKN